MHNIANLSSFVSVLHDAKNERPAKSGYYLCLHAHPDNNIKEMAWDVYPYSKINDAFNSFDSTTDHERDLSVDFWVELPEVEHD